MPARRKSPSAPPELKGRFPYRRPILEHLEDVQLYVPGGYHPVDLGDTLTNGHNRYTIIHKLGHGGFSTVWLVKRQQTPPIRAADSETSSFHALKILCSDVGDMGEDHEARVLRRLGQVGTSGGHPNIVTLEDSFTVSGPNGNHRCLVFPFLGPKLASPRAEDALNSSKRHQVCRQLASAVAFLHEKGVSHGGKLPLHFPRYSVAMLT
jgi:serine/threonine protein kinase